MRALGIALALLAATPARAELPPHVYEQARAGATEVLVLEVSGVAGLTGGETSGVCVLTGVVASVERGDRHPVGGAMAVEAPCVGATYRPMPGPFPGYSSDGLRLVKRVRVFLRDGELVRRGLDDVSSEPGPA